LHADARHRVARFVHHVTGDDAAARQGEIDARQLLRLVQLQWCAGLKRSTLAIRQRNESGLRHVDRIASGRQLGEFVRAISIRQHATAAGHFGGVDENARSCNRPPGIGRQHAAGDASFRGRRGIRRGALG